MTANRGYYRRHPKVSAREATAVAETLHRLGHSADLIAGLLGLTAGPDGALAAALHEMRRPDLIDGLRMAPLSARQVRAEAERILARLPVEPDEVIAARREAILAANEPPNRQAANRAAALGTGAAA